LNEKNIFLQKSGRPWRWGHIKICCVFFQNLIELFTPTNGRVVDLTCSSGASILATCACGRHLLEFEGNNDMFEHILKPLMEKVSKEWSSKENI
jgi:DNA modification methylase